DVLHDVARTLDVAVEQAQRVGEQRAFVPLEHRPDPVLALVPASLALGGHAREGERPGAHRLRAKSPNPPRFSRSDRGGTENAEEKSSGVTFRTTSARPRGNKCGRAFSPVVQRGPRPG